MPCWINAWNDLWHFGHMWCETWHYGHDFSLLLWCLKYIFKFYLLFFLIWKFNFAHIFVHFDYLTISWALCFFFTLPMTINWCTKVRTSIYFHLFLEFYNINTKFHINFEFFHEIKYSNSINLKKWNSTFTYGKHLKENCVPIIPRNSYQTISISKI